jgi:ferric-dicitrate binding protein FerR (iron transport regulator)
LENGEEVTLTKGTQFQTQNAISNGEEIVYQQLSSPAPALPSGRQSRENNKPQTTNTLTIPRGGQFYIKMSDGTKVWLNSESQLKYPVSFTDGESRQVELVYGEAYFEVSPSTKHKGSDFKVVHNKQEVQVLGTAFNIKAYKDETNVYTTLVEGSVAINYVGRTQKLVPGQQSNLNVNANTLTISEVDVKTEIAWKDGVFNFKEKSLKDIMKVLSRWYDMEVVFENKELENVGFVGVLRKNQDIEDILSLIKSTSINNYEINNKTIILK